MQGLSRRNFLSRLGSAASVIATQLPAWNAGCRTQADQDPVIDVHVHADFHDAVLRQQAETLSAVDFSPQCLLREMEQNCVRHAFSIGFVTEDSKLSREATNPMGDAEEAALANKISLIGGINPYQLDEVGLRRVQDTIEAGRIKGLKIYLGYYPFGPDADRYRPVYELAGRYQVPVMFHTGDTYSADALVRLAHPLAIDDIAVEYRDVTFILAHLGNPWTIDAAELLYKNDNVYGDLSGFFVGDRHYFSDPEKSEGISHAVDRIRRAFAWVENPKKFMFGTDWPLVPIQPYIDFVREAIPRAHHRAVFYSNAVSVFGLQD